MNRGDVVVGSTRSGFGGKPRPALVIQSDAYSGISTVILALMSSDDDASRIDSNITVEPSPENGLRKRSWVMVHSLATARVDEIDQRIGAIDSVTMQRVDLALLLFLGLVRP